MKNPMLKISEDTSGNVNVVDLSNRAYNTPLGRIVKKDDKHYSFKRSPFTARLTSEQEYQLQWMLYEMEKGE